MEFFRGEALLFSKFFRGKHIFFRGKPIWKSSGVNAIVANFQG